IAMVFQDPAAYLNPLLNIGTQMADVLHGQDSAGGAKRRPSREVRARSAALLASVGLPEPERLLDARPHQLSGGMRQRVLIAMALAGEPSLLVADEPTTALDVTVQAQILALIAVLVAERGLTLMLISHDLGVIAASCARVAVMYAGTVVEDAPTATLLATPRHPYTKGLLAALPDLDNPAHRPRGIPGSIPSLRQPPPGCRFHPRCPIATARCSVEKPLLREVGDAAPSEAALCDEINPMPRDLGRLASRDGKTAALHVGEEETASPRDLDSAALGGLETALPPQAPPPSHRVACHYA
ncbi:MAG: transporter ATP-binding protein, partial [Rhodospirillales bacterium]|nr:transporter ATP-binding protein [Rhodospirillales bacterium]